MKPQRKVELVAIGDELLNGIRINTHLGYIGDQLARKGLPLTLAAEVRDEPDNLASYLKQVFARADLVLLTGGLGPTSDDNTAQCVAKALGRPLHHDHGIEQSILEFFQQRGRIPTPNNLKQCLIVEGADALGNPNGTAPGQWIDNGGQVIVLLPGPPLEMHPMFENEVLPRLTAKGWITEAASPVEIRTIGIGESQLADMLGPVLSGAGNAVQVAYCAHSGYVDVRLASVPGGWDPVKVRSLGEACRDRIGDHFLGYGSPDVAAVILNQLRGLNKSLAVAESCTGGLLASRFTDVPGASKVFKGGVVCYLNEIKEQLLSVPRCLLEQHGAVSAECAAALATGAAELMESDYALSITGYAGPEAGDEPAGTIYLGYHSPIGVWSRKVILPGNRTAVKERAVTASLDFVRRKLEKYKVYDLLESLRC